MRVLLLLCLFLQIAVAHAQETYSVPKAALDPKAIVSKFFEATLDTKSEEFVWQPNFAERLDFGASTNGLLYTTIDTLLYASPKKERFTLALNTYCKDETGERQSGHVNAPSLSLIGFALNSTTNTYELEYFKKFVCHYGSFGYEGEVELLPITEEDYAIVVIGGYTAQGITTENKSLYRRGQLVLDFCSSEDNGGWTDDEALRYEYHTKINVDTVANTLTLVKTGTEIDEQTQKKVPVNQSTTYQWDENSGWYTKVCKP